MRIFISICFSLMACWAYTQDSLIIGQDFYFADGIYKDIEAVQKNIPTWNWDEVDAEAYIDHVAHTVRFNSITQLDNPIDLTTFWGISIEGEMYINLHPYKGKDKLRSHGEEPILFTKLYAIGKLCYFYYEGYRPVKKEMKVYHPITRKLVGARMIDREEKVTVKRLLKFETGEVLKYSLDNFLNCIQEDKKLWLTLSELNEIEARDKLYKSLFIYNDRNPIFVTN